MADVTIEKIEEILKKIIDPTTGKDIVSSGMVNGLQTKDGHVAFTIEVDPSRGAEMEPLRKEAEQIVQNLSDVISTTVVLTAERAAESQAAPTKQANQNKALRVMHCLV